MPRLACTVVFVCAAMSVVVAALAPASAPAQESGGAAAPALRPGEVVFRPAEGAKFAYVLRLGLLAEQKVPKRKFTGSGASTNHLEMTVGARDASGATPMTIRVLRSVGWWVDDDHPKLEFDTSKEPVPAAHPAHQMVQFLAPPSVRVLPDGRIAEIDALVAAQRAALRLPADERQRAPFAQDWHASLPMFGFAATWPPLPPKRTGAGTFFETESFAPWPRSHWHLLRLRTEVQGIDEKRVVLDTKGGIDDLDPANAAGRSKKKGDMPAGPKVKSSGFASHAEVDRADGVVRKSSARSTLVLAKQFTVDGDSVDGTSSWTWESALERVEALPDPPPRADAPAESGETPKTPAPAPPR